jgi:hypothetical protein
MHNLSTTTSLELPEELPSVEDSLKILCATLKTLEMPGLDAFERFEISNTRSNFLYLKDKDEITTTYQDIIG